MNYIKHTVAAHEHLRRQSDARPQHIALYWALFFAWNTEYFDQDGLSMDHLALMQAARIGNQRTYRATLYDLDNWGLIAYQPSKARGTTTTCKLTELLRAEVPVQNASTGRSAPTNGVCTGRSARTLLIISNFFSNNRYKRRRHRS